MDRRRFVAAGIAVVATGSGVAHAQYLDPYDVPASAVIRGENVWLRAEPAAETEIVTYLQRGDEVTLTDAAVRADGADFVPVETANGESGWVRDLFVDPRSIAPASEPERRSERAAEEAPTADEAGAAEDRQNRRQRRQNGDAAAAAAEEPPASPAPEEASEPAAPPPASESEATGIGASPENPAPLRTEVPGDGVTVNVGNGRRLPRVETITPSADHEFLQITIRITNTSAEEATFGPDNFRAEDAQTGEVYAPASIEAERILTMSALQPRQSVTGLLYFEIPQTTSRAIIVFDTAAPASQTFYWTTAERDSEG